MRIHSRYSIYIYIWTTERHIYIYIYMPYHIDYPIISGKIYIYIYSPLIYIYI